MDGCREQSWWKDGMSRVAVGWVGCTSDEVVMGGGGSKGKKDGMVGEVGIG